MAEKIVTESGIDLLLEKRTTEKETEISLRLESGRTCILHWGLRHPIQTAWQVPPEEAWPKGSNIVDSAAVQTPFRKENGIFQIQFRLNHAFNFPFIVFSLFFPEENRWDNNQGRNYRIEISPPASRPIDVLKESIPYENIFYEHAYQLEDHYQLAVAVTQKDFIIHVILITNIPGKLMLHWGIVRRFRNEWMLPPASLHPPKTTIHQDKAAESPFEDRTNMKRLEIRIREADAIIGIPFVLRHPDTARWLKNDGKDFFIPLPSASGHDVKITSGLSKILDIIVEKETGGNSWTLMHRFNLCFDLLDHIHNDPDGLAILFVWLRFSAIRQLDWQRNYNTKPKELSHAQDRLTKKLADRYIHEPGERHFIRLILTTMGRGGEGQRIRDEILNIMHRHHIKEVAGRFMEEWHQKLHNNTTPDDVIICEAYLSFLRENGNLDSFYKKLQQGGITKNRLKSYDRPIQTSPDFIPHLKEALIHDFEAFLGILKNVHSGTDLGAAIHSARYFLDFYMHEFMDYIWAHRDDGPSEICLLVEKITDARKWIFQQLGKESESIRDLLFLDLALEDFLRVLVERNLHLKLSEDQLVSLIGLLVENRLLADDDTELSQCARHWKLLNTQPRFGQSWSLHAQAIVERLGRIIGGFIDRYYQMLQPKAEFLGKAFKADSWAISLFTEEIVRGRPAFVLVMLLRYLHPILRKKADIGNWQVVSRGQGLGEVEVVTHLKSVQGETYDHSTVIVTDKIAGDEEIPQGITAIITPDTTDIVSHVAIRARNAKVLIATCYDPKTIDHLKSLKGQVIKLDVNAAGEVTYGKGLQEPEVKLKRLPRAHISIPRHDFIAYALLEKDFSEQTVGGKSNNLKQLRARLPENIGIPASVALPFGVFEKVLADESNQTFAEHYTELSKNITETNNVLKNELLGELRKTVLALNAPDELMPTLHKVMEKARMVLPQDFNEAWHSIKHVWSSKWNERAFLSRIAQGIPHDALFMAVLIQEVVKAEYSYVIHTLNPLTGDKDEILAEVVLGLGETLVGNYPGRALGFTFKKNGKSPHILSFPSKSIGLFGSGLIFRSDSNGEDLKDYAGAGLYDSVMFPPPHTTSLDYSTDPLIANEGFQRQFLNSIAQIGITIEKKMDSAQDIEGAYCSGKYYVVQTRHQVG